MSILLSAVFVLAYITLGGLSGAIYNEVLQFFVIIAGLIPLVIIGLKDVGGWCGLEAQGLAQAGTENFFDLGRHPGRELDQPAG